MNWSRINNLINICLNEVDNYSSFKHMKPFQERKQEFINSIKSFNDFDEQKIKEAIDYFGYEGYNDKEDAFDDLNEKIDFYKKMPNPATLYRVVGVKNRKLIKTNDLGEHFTPYKWNIDGDMLLSIGYENWDENTKPYIMETSVPHSEIDIIQTIIQNLSFPNEHEITLKNNGRGAKLVKISKFNKLNELIDLSLNEYLNEQVNSLSDIDLYNIAKWGLEGEYSTSSCWDDTDNLEDAIKCAVEDFKLFLSKPYPIELGNIPNNPIIYRLVRLKNINDLNKNKLGISWFSNPKQIDNPEFFQMLDHLKPYKNKEGEVYIIKGQTTKDNIDMKRTLWERSTQWFENEIVIINDSNVKILSIKPLSKIVSNG
jgi:hypothetical protein